MMMTLRQSETHIMKHLLTFTNHAYKQTTTSSIRIFKFQPSWYE